MIQEFCRISEVKEDLHYVLSQISVLGLELESIWDEIELNQNMETNIPYLFIAGDSSGLAQGILQAAISGVAAAYGIIEKKNNNKEVSCMLTHLKHLPLPLVFSMRKTIAKARSRSVG